MTNKAAATRPSSAAEQTPLTRPALADRPALRTRPTGQVTKPSPPQKPKLGLIIHDHLMPKSALAVMSLSPLGEHKSELVKTGSYRLLRPVWRSIPKGGLGKLLQGSWSTDHLETVLSSGLTLAWTGLSFVGTPTWLLAANLGDTEGSFREALRVQVESLQRSGFKLRKEVFRQDNLWTLDAPDSSVSLTYTIRAGTLFVGTRQNEIQLAVARLLDSGGYIESLADSKHYQSFCARQQREGKPFLTVYVQPTLLADRMLALVPSAQQLRVRQALGRLELHKMHDLAYTLRVGEGLLHEFFWLTYPAPRAGLLAALLGTARRMNPEVARLVSADAIYASVYHLNFRRIHDSLVSLSSVFSHHAPQQINMMIKNLETRTHISLTRDVLDTLSDEVVVQQWSERGSATANVAVTIGLKDESRFRNALGQLAKLANVKRHKVRGTTAYSLDMPILPPGLTPYLLVHKGQLVFATTQQARDTMVANLESLQGNSRMAKLIANLNVEANSISWGNCAALGKELAETLSTQSGSLLAGLELGEALDQIGGEMVAVATQNPEGLMVRSRSPYGNTYLSVAMAFGLRLLVQRMPGATPERDAAHEQDPAEIKARRMSALLKQIANAQSLYRASAARDNNRNGIGEYGTITELVSAQCLPENLLGRRVGDDTYAVDEFLVKVMLPSGPSNQERHYAVIAWPGKRRRGLVFAITEAGLPQVNPTIAQVEGLNNCDPRDLFISGRFDLGLVEGWRSVVTASEAARARLKAAAEAKQAESTENQRFYEAVLEAEKTRKVTPEAMRALESSDPDIAARAAYAMGMLKAKNAVPPLCQLVASHEAVQVRRQAMAALTKIRDPRSVATSMRALSDPDFRVRAHAATNLGRLRTKASVTPLLNLLTRSVEGSGADHVAALLALADIGDPRSLASAATVVRSTDAKIGEALTYLFQRVSPRMQPQEEIKPLLVALDSNCLMLRRYVIQRLGVLKDPLTLTALENQLAKEDRQLQPLISVSLNAIRGQAGESISFKARMEAWLVKAQQRWQALSQRRKYALMGIGAAVFLMFVVFLIWRKRRRRQLAGETWARMARLGSDLAARHPNRMHAQSHEHGLGHGEPADVELEHGGTGYGEDALGEDALGEDALGEDALGEDALGEDVLGMNEADAHALNLSHGDLGHSGEEHDEEQYGFEDDSQSAAGVELLDEWSTDSADDMLGADRDSGQKLGRLSED